MMATENPCAAETDDSALVEESLAGDREAFRQIVERHQTLVCSLAYCATASLTQSEDLAQETFLVAWRQLPELREPSKLRPWLCGIARFVIGKELRRQGREPVHAAETLETVNELAAPEPLPSDRAISREEQAILWHCVARIPEIYREPLVLFYREHQSIERVAEALELSEDAVKQRLTRGRKLLQEQTLAYVEGALQSTNPGHAFTLAILAALPLTATSAKAATVGAAVKSGSTAKVVTGLAAVGAIILYWSLLGFLVFAGCCAGYWMSRASARSSQQCENTIGFWRNLARGFAVFIVIPQLFFIWAWKVHLFIGLSIWVSQHDWLFWWACPELFCALAVAALADWILLWWRGLSGTEGKIDELGRPLKRRLMIWLSFGLIGPTCLSVLPVWEVLSRTYGPARSQQISGVQARKILTTRKDAIFDLHKNVDDGTKTVRIYLPENSVFPGLVTAYMSPAWGSEISGKTILPILLSRWANYWPIDLWTAADDSTLKLLAEKHIRYVETGGHSPRVGPPQMPWRLFGLMLFCFIAPMGAAILLLQIGKRQWAITAPRISNPLEQENTVYGRTLLALRSDLTAQRIFTVVFTVVFLLVSGENAFVLQSHDIAIDLYEVLIIGSVKGAFFGLMAGIAVLYWRTQRRIRNHA